MENQLIGTEDDCESECYLCDECASVNNICQECDRVSCEDHFHHLEQLCDGCYRGFNS